MSRGPCRKRDVNVADLRRAPPLRLLVPRRRLAAGGARRAGGRARLRGARAHRPRRRLRVARVRVRRRRSASARSPAPRRRSPTARTSRCSSRRRRAMPASAASSPRHTPHERLNPRLDPALLAEESEGLVCLSGCARHGLAVRDPNAAADLARALGPDRFYVELQRPYERGDARRNAALRALAEASASARSPPATSTHHPRRTRLQDVLVRSRTERPSRAARPSGAGTGERPARSARGRRPLPGRPRRPSAARSIWPSGSPSTSRRSWATATRTSPTARRPRTSSSPTSAAAPSRSASPRAAPASHPRGKRLREELALIAELGLSGFFLLHWEVLELARDVAAEVRGPAHRVICPSRRVDGELGRLDRLLPDRALARRSRGRRPRARPLPEPRALVGARHRPRLPARHPREADRRRHERYGREHSALVASFATYRARGAIRDVGKALGLPQAELERLARVSDGWNARKVGEEMEHVPGRTTASPRRAGAPSGSSAGDRRLLRHSRSTRGHGHLLAAARRARSGRAGGDGRPPELPVGQGLLRRCRLPQDRPARAGNALRRRGVRRADRASAREADRPLPHPARRPGRLPGDPGRGHGRPLPDREPCADAEPSAHAAREPRRPHDPGRARPPRTDPGQGRAPVHRAAAAPARGPGLRAALRPSVARGAAARDARRDHLPGAGAWTWPWPSPASRSGRPRAAAGDEPQAEPGRDGGLPAPLPRGRPGKRRRPRDRGARLLQARGFASFGFPKSHAAAFALLAYQSAWLRHHYPEEFLCSS